MHTVLLLVALLTGACCAFAWAPMGHTGGSPPPAAPTANIGVAAAQPAPVEGAPPVRIVIPSIAVSADIEPLHTAVDGTLNTPAEWNNAGWYADGVAPGDRGPAVIVGHRDSASDGPAVFYQLPQVQLGDTVLVEASDGTTHRFLVDTSREASKDDFPTGLVYGPAPLAELRLITCTGSFDHATGNYRDNLIVTAHAV